MLKQKYFLTGIFILSAERQPIKLAWRKIVWLPIQVFRKMLVEEFGIKSTEQFFSTEGEDMAVIYESMKVEQENFNLTDEETNAVLDIIFDELDAQNADNKQQTD